MIQSKNNKQIYCIHFSLSSLLKISQNIEVIKQSVKNNNVVVFICDKNIKIPLNLITQSNIRYLDIPSVY